MTDARFELLTVAAAALVRADGCVLVQQRLPGGSMAGLWEFPGGKLEQGETPEAALARELREELGLGVDPIDCVPLAFSTGVAGARPLLLLLFRVRRWRGEPVLHHAQALRWASLAELRDLAMPPADVPLVEALAPALR